MAESRVTTRWTWITGLPAIAQDGFVRVALPVGGFWAATALIGLADFGAGRERVLGILALACGVTVLGRVPGRLAASSVVLLAVLCAWLLSVRCYQAWDSVTAARTPWIDVGSTTVHAVHVFVAGGNPYTEKIDGELPGVGLHYMNGFKYGPLMVLAYLPTVTLGGEPWYFVTTLVAVLVTAAGAALWAARAGGRPAALGAATLVFSIPFLDDELFRGGINDIVPIGPAVLAFALRARGAAVAAGVLIGLSIGAKLLPGLLLVPVLLLAHRDRRVAALLAAAGTALAAYLPALVTSPRELFGNLVLFNVDREPDSTSLRDNLGPFGNGLVQAAALLGLLVTLWLLHRATRGAPDTAAGGTDAVQARVAGFTTVSVAMFFVASSLVHRNYLFWLLPLLAVAVAGRVWAADRAPQPPPIPEQAGTAEEGPLSPGRTAQPAG